MDRRWAVLILALVALSVPAGAEDAEIGQTLWPPEDHHQPAKVHTLLDEALGTGEEPLRLGDREVDQAHLERVNATVSTMHVRLAGENGTRHVELHHRPAPLAGDVEIAFPADRLPLVTEATTDDPPETAIPVPPRFRAQAPPAAFASDPTEAPEAQAADVADRLGLPGEEAASIDRVRWTQEEKSAVTGPLAGLDACLGNATANCSTRARFTVDCSRCVTWVREAHPLPEERLERAWPEGVPVGTPIANRAWFTFDADRRLVEAGLNLHVALNTSAMTAPDEARAIVETELADRGYEPKDRSVGVALRFHTPNASLGGGTYDWFLPVVPTANASHGPGRYHARVHQDPLDGTILDVEVTRPDQGGGANETRERANASGTLQVSFGPVLAAAALAVASKTRRSSADRPSEPDSEEGRSATMCHVGDRLE